MKSRLLIFVSVFVALFVLVGQFRSLHASTSTADCYQAGSGGSYSFDFDFTCADAQTVYFGVCDSGPVLDDFFEIAYKGSVVGANIIVGNDEIITVGSGSSDAGANTATLNVLLAPDGAPTWSYAVSSAQSDVEAYLSANCGGDIGGFVPVSTSNISTCQNNVALFTEDGAPTDGTLEFHILLGNEGARGDEQIMMTWDLTEGAQINNAPLTDLPSPRYARVWWQPDGASDWYMLSSQYWSSGSWSTDQEYGITCNDPQPSYHTSFANAVPESDVCFDLLNGCN